MKTRIISGVVLALAVVGILWLNSLYPITAVVVIALLAAVSAYEMLYGTKIVQNKAAVIAAAIYSAAVQFAYEGFLSVEVITYIYVCFIALVAISKYGKFGTKQIAFSLSMPLIISYAFHSLTALINSADGFGILYFILLFNFSSVSDIFAYFVGSAIGKHKMAPVISPKKSYEGLFGGIIGSLIGIVIICLVFNNIYEKETLNLWLLLAVTPIFCLIGVAGDLFTSAIKRECGIKDYGKLIPGHGGVLDRLDSVLLVAPALAIFLSFAEVIH